MGRQNNGTELNYSRQNNGTELNYGRQNNGTELNYGSQKFRLLESSDWSAGGLILG